MKEILVPISLGELYDKLTILTIKSERIKDAEKLKNIEKEFQLLNSIAFEHPIESHYWYDLIHINSHLWAIEDGIRIKESRKEYDAAFISLAKEVYYSNDRRSDIKKAINLQYGSDIVEEKSYEKYD